jgi:choline transporter-like protein 2/4/5
VQLSAAVCIESCPTTTELVSLTNVICTYDDYPETETELTIQVVSKKCSSFVYHSTPILQRCVPVNPVPLEVLVSAGQAYGNETVPGTGVSANEIINSGRTVTMQVVADLLTSKWIIVGSTFASVVVCFVYIILMRYFARIMVWATILVTNGVLGALGVWLYFYWRDFQDYYYAIDESLRTDLQTWELRGILAALVVVALAFVVILLITVFLRKRIAIAVEITREAAKAIGSMPLIGISMLNLTPSILPIGRLCANLCPPRLLYRDFPLHHHPS